MTKKNNAFISSANIKMPKPNKSFNSKTTAYDNISKPQIGNHPNELK